MYKIVKQIQLHDGTCLSIVISHKTLQLVKFIAKSFNIDFLFLALKIGLANIFTAAQQ